ncbi:MAG: methyl-accepting chemotaxis protein [Actinomycetota bacterium]
MGAKIGAGVGCVLAVFAVVGVLVYVNVGKLADNAEQADRTHHTLEEIEQSLIAVLEIESGLYHFIVTGEDTSLVEYEHGLSTLPEHVTAGQALTEEHADQQQRWDDLDPELDLLLVESAQLITLRRDQGFEAARSALAASDIEETVVTIHELLHDLADAEAALVSERATATATSVSTTRLSVIAGIALATLVGIGVVLYLSRSIAGPLRKTAERARQIASGSLDIEPLGLNRSDELGELDDSFGVMVDSLKTMVDRLAEAGERLGQAAKGMSGVSAVMADSAERTSTEAGAAAATGDRVSTNVANVATSIEQMNAAISEVSVNAQQASSAAADAVDVAKQSSDTISKLSESSDAIEDISKVINAIAEQTNLLALNATIEAARAGEAGKGFAVVANEVKDLATQTAGATEKISQRIRSIQDHTSGAVESNELIGDTIDRISNISASIAAAVEEQSFTASEISRSVEQAASGTRDIAHSVTDVSAAAEQTLRATTETREATEELAEMATEINELVSAYH